MALLAIAKQCAACAVHVLPGSNAGFCLLFQANGLPSVEKTLFSERTKIPPEKSADMKARARKERRAQEKFSGDSFIGSCLTDRG